MIAYVLTGSLAFPVGLRFAAEFRVASVFGQAGSGFPALVRVERSLGTGAVKLPSMTVPSVALLGLIVAWVRVTPENVSLDESLTASVRRRQGRLPGE